MASKLHSIRISKDMPQKELAAKAGVSINTLKMLEYETRDIKQTSVDTVFRLAAALEVPVSEIVDLDKIMMPDKKSVAFHIVARRKKEELERQRQKDLERQKQAELDEFIRKIKR